MYLSPLHRRFLTVFPGPFLRLPKRLVVELFMLVNGFTGQLHAELLEHLNVHIGEHNRGVNLAAFQLWKLLHSLLCNLVGGCAGGESDEDSSVWRRGLTPPR